MDDKQLNPNIWRLVAGYTGGKGDIPFHLKLATFRSESRSAQAENKDQTTVRTRSRQGGGVKNSKICRLTAHWERQPRLAPCSCSAGRHHVGSRHPCASLPQHTPEQLRVALLVTAMQDPSYLSPAS